MVEESRRARARTGQAHAKLRELVHADLTSYAAIEPELAGYDACCFCLGVSAATSTSSRRDGHRQI